MLDLIVKNKKTISIAILAFIVFNVFGIIVIKYISSDKSKEVSIEKTTSDNPDFEYYKSKLSDLYDKVELFKSDLANYGETDEVKREYVSITKSHSDFSTAISQYNVNNPNNKLVLPSLEDIKTLSLDELYVIMFNN
jgi:hypothetical protein